MWCTKRWAYTPFSNMSVALADRQAPAEEKAIDATVAAVELLLSSRSTTPTGTRYLSWSTTERGESHEQSAQGEGSTRVRGKNAGLRVVRHPRQQGGGGAGGGRGRKSSRKGGGSEVTEKQKPEGCELVVEGGEEGKRRAEQAVTEEPQYTRVGLGYQTARHWLGDPPERRGGSPGTGHAPVPSWTAPEKTWCEGSVLICSSSGTWRYVFDVGKGCTCSALVVWLNSRERRGTGTTPLPSSRLRSPALATGQTEGSGPSGPWCSQSGGADVRGYLWRPGSTQPGALVRMGLEQLGCIATTRCNFLG